jgi:hypothetical protein
MRILSLHIGAIIPVRDTQVPNLIANLHPVIAASRNWANLAATQIRGAGNDESAEEVEVVDVRCTSWDWLADGTYKPNDVD